MCLRRPNCVWAYLHKNARLSSTVTCYWPYSTVGKGSHSQEGLQVLFFNCATTKWEILDILRAFFGTQMLNLFANVVRETNVLTDVFVFCANWELFNISGNAISHFLLWDKGSVLSHLSSLPWLWENRHARYLFIMVRACFQLRRRPTQTYTWHGSADLCELNF